MKPPKLETKAKPVETVTSQSAEALVSTENSNKKKKKKKNKQTAVENEEKSTAEQLEVKEIKTTSSPGKFVKAPESNVKAQKTTKPPAAQQKPNKRKFNEDKNASPGHNNAKKMKFNNKKFNKNAPSTDISENRLKAFGINPKKFKNKLKYGPGKNNNQNGHQKSHKNEKPFHKKKTQSQKEK